jgi:hypothetical protein
MAKYGVNMARFSISIHLNSRLRLRALCFGKAESALGLNGRPELEALKKVTRTPRTVHCRPVPIEAAQA